jgi:FAD synthetase
LSAKELVTKYVVSAEQVLRELVMVEVATSISPEDAKNVVECARAYLDDAKYYKDKGKLAVSLTSIAYCEGLLDALRLLGAVKFEWPTKPSMRRERLS